MNDTTTPCLVVAERGKTWRVELQDVLVIGRGSTDDVVLASPDVSRAHARVERRGDEFWLRDLASRNGTFVGRFRVEEQMLEDGDTIQIGPARLAFKSGFSPEKLGEGPESGDERRPVVVIPGMMGSELWRGDERIWPNLRAMFTHPDVGALPDTVPVKAGPLVDDIVIVPNLVKLDQYKRLGGYLVEELGYRRDVDLLEFGYDWRLDCRQTAAALGAAIDSWRERERLARRPLTIIAHSLGCLLARYYVERLGGKDVVDRLVLIGGPHAGVPKVVPSLARGPALLPFGLFDGRLHDVLQTFPSVYQILPVDECATDESGSTFSVFDDESWLADWQRALARDARAFRQELGATTTVPTVCIFGYGIETIMGLDCPPCRRRLDQPPACALRRGRPHDPGRERDPDRRRDPPRTTAPRLALHRQRCEDALEDRAHAPHATWDELMIGDRLSTCDRKRRTHSFSKSSVDPGRARGSRSTSRSTSAAIHQPVLRSKTTVACPTPMRGSSLL